MIISLPSGEAVRISEDQYFNMTDEQYKEFIWKTRGSEIEDPFYDSVLSNKSNKDVYEEYNGVVPVGQGDIEHLDIPE